CVSGGHVLMTYFADLTPYTYLNDVSPDSSGNRYVLNVGWLDRAHAFQAGASPDGLVRGLVSFCKNPTNLTRGIHFCNLCPQLSPTEYRERWNELTRFSSPHGNVMVGNGEIRVYG